MENLKSFHSVLVSSKEPNQIKIELISGDGRDKNKQYPNYKSSTYSIRNQTISKEQYDVKKNITKTANL